MDFDRCIDRRNSDSAKWRLYGEDVLPLWVADMDFASPEPVLRALQERVAHGVFGYGAEPPALRSVIVGRLARLYGWEVPEDAILFVPGVVTGLNVACRAFARPGQSVLVQTPVYPPILHAPANAQLSLCETELSLGEEGRYEIDFDDFARGITEQTQMFVLCNPHNPVGRVFSRRELARMADICLAHGLLIVADEIHSDLVFHGAEHTPIACLSDQVADRTVTLMAPSKTYNLPGLSCSYAIITNEKLRAAFQAARVGIVPGVNVLGYAAALAAYQDGGDWLNEALAYLEGNRDFLDDCVRAALPGITMRRPEGTYLAWLDCRGAELPCGPFDFFLQRAKVALSDGALFGQGGTGFVRLNFACPRSMLAEALKRMGSALGAR